MRSPHAVVMLWIAAVGFAPTAAEAVTRAQLDQAVQRLRANAALWQQDKNTDASVEIALKGVEFDVPTARHLADIIEAAEPDANSLYVVNRLLWRLRYTKKEPIRVILPALKDLHAKARRVYKSLPELTEEQIKALKEPSSQSPNALAALEQRRRKKVTREKPIAKHNLMVYTLERFTYRLMLMAADTAEDELVVKALIDEEQIRSAIFLTIIDALAADARKMSEKRGAKIFQALRPVGLELKWEPKKAYVNRGKVEIKADDASSFQKIETYPGIRLLTMLNHVASAGRQPALKIPKAKDVDKGRKTGRKASTAPKRTTTGGRK